MAVLKFIHTADWHLGKLVHGVYMTEDQREVLRQFVELVEEENLMQLLLREIFMTVLSLPQAQ